MNICTRHHNDIYERGKTLCIYEPFSNIKAQIIYHDDIKVIRKPFNDSDKKTKEKPKRCIGITQKNTKCKRNNNGVSKGCFQHDPNHARKNISSSKKEYLWLKTVGKKFVGECYVCRHEITPFRFEVGHNISKCNGGDNNIENLRCICSKCNRSMGTQNLETFKKDLMN